MVRIAVIYFLAPRIPRGQRGTNSPVVGGRGSHESKVGTSGQLPAGGNERKREREADREGAGLGRKEGKGFRRGTTRVKRYIG